MKKSMMLFFAAIIMAAMTGCGGGSSAKSKSTGTTETISKSENAFDVAPEASVTNTTYKTSASGDFPPAPPVADLQSAQDEANSNL